MSDQQKKSSSEPPASSVPGAADGKKQVAAGQSDTKVSGVDLAVSLLLYTVARIGLVLVFAALIFFIPRAFGVDVPPIVALAFGALLAIPLGMYLFKSLRLRVNEQISAIDSARAGKREDLESRLRGGS